MRKTGAIAIKKVKRYEVRYTRVEATDDIFNGKQVDSFIDLTKAIEHANSIEDHADNKSDFIGDGYIKEYDGLYEVNEKRLD